MTFQILTPVNSHLVPTWVNSPNLCLRYAFLKCHSVVTVTSYARGQQPHLFSQVLWITFKMLPHGEVMSTWLTVNSCLLVLG